jgi:hypothetical protein
MKEIFATEEFNLDVEAKRVVIPNDAHIGILWGATQNKSWVMEIEGGFIGLEIGAPDLTSHWKAATKQEYIYEAFDQAGLRVFQFGDEDLLRDWVMNRNQ